jgi:hypothetical protein
MRQELWGLSVGGMLLMRMARFHSCWPPAARVGVWAVTPSLPPVG